MSPMTVRAAVLTGTAALVTLTVLTPAARRHQPAPAPFPTDLTQRDLQAAGQGCGTERWVIKTASDSGNAQVNTTPHSTTIAALRNLAKPSSLPANSRIRPTEVTEYVITGTLTKYKGEDDSDIHMVITDNAGHTLIAELASTSCVASSRFKTQIANARKQFTARYTPTSSFKTDNRKITLRGIGFFDYRHGQTGVAPNGIELHPVLAIAWP